MPASRLVPGLSPLVFGRQAEEVPLSLPVYLRAVIILDIEFCRTFFLFRFYRDDSAALRLRLSLC